MKDKCVVRVGRIAREDPDAEVRIVQKVNGEIWTEVERVFVRGKKKLEFDLEPGDYHVMVVGDKKAGVATTAEMDMTFPWNVHLDPPEDHSKDYLRLNIPTNVPLTPDVAKAVKKALAPKPRAISATDQKSS